MSSQWKNLQSKYKSRRVALVIIGALVLIGIGWGLGKLFSNIQEKKLADSLALGDSVTQEPTVIQSVQPPKVEPKVEPDIIKLPPKDLPPWELLIVNNKNKLPADFKVELEKVSGNYQVDARVATPLKQMIAAARREGINLELIAAYRDSEEEAQVFSDRKAELLSQGLSEKQMEEELLNSMAIPEFSEHQIGLGVDLLSPEHTKGNLDFRESLGYDWLEENAVEYGFILRYPMGKEKLTFREFNPWHYRFVGLEVAKVIQESGLCLEEYVAYKNADYDLPLPKDQVPKEGEEKGDKDGNKVENPA